MIKTVNVPVSSINRNENGQLMIGPDFAMNEDTLVRACKWNKVPAALVGIDEKHNTNYTTEVLKAVVGNDGRFNFVVDDANGQVLSYIRPDAEWVPDEIFLEMDFDGALQLPGNGFTSTTETGQGGARCKKTFTVISNDDPNDRNSFMGDVFKKQLIVERCEEGGLQFTFGLLRLACTNGMTVNEKGFTKTFKALGGNVDALNYARLTGQKVVELDLPKYLRNLWTDEHGELIKASVGHYTDMKRVLESITDEDVANVLFPMNQITEHYSNQGIDLKKLTYSQKYGIPSGVSYYDAFNFLTNGIKAKADLDLGEKIRVGQMASPSKLKALKSNLAGLNFSGEPYFSREEIHRLAGDRVFA